MDGDPNDLNAQEPSTDPSGQSRQSGDRSDGRPESEATEGVLSSLPRTRPQRASPRRAAQAKAKQKAAPKATAKAKPKRKPSPKKAPPRPASELPPRPKAPRQGYEPEEDLDVGRTIHPPSAVELVESVADIALELASASLKSGGRLLKDALSPLRRS